MHSFKTAERTSSFAVKGGILFYTRREPNLKSAGFVSLNTTDRNFKHNDLLIEGQSGLCSCARKYNSIQKVSVSLNFGRHIFTSGKCMTVKVDSKKNYYHILGVTPSCSITKIKQAYYRLSKVYHPDVSKTKAAIARFHELTEAYEVLSNPSLKHIYDSSRIGKLHGVHKGAGSSHPVNFSAKGPHQMRRVDKQHFDHRMKSHYSNTFKRFQRDIKKHELELHLQENWHRGGDSGSFSSIVILSVALTGIAYLVYKMFDK